MICTPSRFFMKTAIIGASGGIGRALADALEEEGAVVRRFARPELDLLDEATTLAETIASKSLPSVYAAKAALDVARANQTVPHLASRRASTALTSPTSPCRRRPPSLAEVAVLLSTLPHTPRPPRAAIKGGPPL